MFIDFVTLLLINMVAGFALLASYLCWGLDDLDQKRWSLGFLPVGVVALVFGGYMTMTWPIIKQFNSVFGECSVLFGVLFLMAGLALALGWRLTVIAGYAAAAAVSPLVFGVRILQMGLTANPPVTGVGFLLSGLAGLCALPTLTVLRGVRLWRLFAALVLAGIAGIWLVTAVLGMWGHMHGFAEWAPYSMRR